MFRATHFVAFAVLCPLVACSGSRSLSHEDLQTEFHASVSLASETELFLNHLNGHTCSAPFIQGHLSYLQSQGAGIRGKLAGASAETHDIQSLEELRNATGDLTQTLDTLRSHSLNPPEQMSSIARLHSIRTRLEADMPR